MNEYPSLATVALNDMSNGPALRRGNTAQFIVEYQLKNRVLSGQWSKGLGRRAGGHRSYRLTRAGLWKKRYLEARTYRGLNDDQLTREFARFILEDYLVLKNGKIGPNIDAAKIDYLGETLEGLFTECELRFVDMRRLGKKMNFLLDQQLVKGDVSDFLMQRKPAKTG